MMQKILAEIAEISADCAVQRNMLTVSSLVGGERGLRFEKALRAELTATLGRFIAKFFVSLG